MVPTIGRIVLYKLTKADVKGILDNRESFPHWRRGNDVSEGQEYPAVIVRVWGEDANSAVNLHVLLDGWDQCWATSRHLGDKPGDYRWPPRT